jgi:queuine/archaeosine tRNA-ribosyltransferase
MSFHLIVTCVSQKRAKRAHSILDTHIEPGTPKQVFDQWSKTLTGSTLQTKKAKDLYKGQLWNAFSKSFEIIKEHVQDAHLWVLSAGHGLIGSEEDILPYDITFQEPRNGVPSILAKVSCNNGTSSRKVALETWWDMLVKTKSTAPASIESLVADASDDDYFLIVLGKDYLDAVFKDLQKAVKKAKNPDQITVISNNTNDPTAKKLGHSWLHADGRFINLPGSNSTILNARIASELLRYTFEEEEGLKWWSIDNINAFLKDLSSGLPDPQKFERETHTDEQVKGYIRAALSGAEISFTKLHRTFRDSNRACEYTRFRGLYNLVKDDLKTVVLKKRPTLRVKHKPRKNSMLFYLPDWDDRVDPIYDFEKDEPTQNRNPYEHDAYHYELYGKLNCDGILVSKSVLEDNVQKKELAQKVGIHKYMRLPRNVPVMGDCGAFNYITEHTPPYETGEILHYYQDLDFDIGVSIDHLIVPGILKRNSYYLFKNNEWHEINKEEFERFEKDPVSIVKKKRSKATQLQLFSDNIVLANEEYIDEKERKRRYDLTIENALLFIEDHRKDGLSFTPIGAAQGWDPDSYAKCVDEYQRMGYNYIALGGLVRSTTSEILNVLDAVSKIRKRNTRLHVFGVARTDALERFINLGVSSVDSAGMLRQAWLSSSSNYYSPDMNHYTAIRVPLAEGKKKKVSSKEYEMLLKKEAICLKSLRDYDRGKISLQKALNKVMIYDELMGGNGSLRKKYKRTLTDKPWKKCPCRLCQDTGVDIVIFRRNNRNRRRGFHNTWVFYNKFKEISS